MLMISFLKNFISYPCFFLTLQFLLEMDLDNLELGTSNLGFPRKLIFGEAHESFGYNCLVIYYAFFSNQKIKIICTLNNKLDIVFSF